MRFKIGDIVIETWSGNNTILKIIGNASDVDYIVRPYYNKDNNLANRHGCTPSKNSNGQWLFASQYLKSAPKNILKSYNGTLIEKRKLL